MADANKTTETRKITELSALWLAERGFKPVESEVPIAEKWVADVAGAAVLTRTEAVNLKLVRRRPKWNSASWREDSEAWNVEYLALPRLVTAAIEVKVSRSDFSRDDKFTRDATTHMLYLAAPTELIQRVSVPESVGLLSFGGTSLRCVRHARMRPVSEQKISEVIFQIAVRRDHFTSYERWREFARQAREDENERTNRAKIVTLVHCCLAVAAGRQSPMEALAFHGIKTGKHEYVTRELSRLVPTPASSVVVGEGIDQ